jgi:predicted ATP-dependent Lon-type protease
VEAEVELVVLELPLVERLLEMVELVRHLQLVEHRSHMLVVVVVALDRLIQRDQVVLGAAVLGQTVQQPLRRLLLTVEVAAEAVVLPLLHRIVIPAQAAPALSS